MALRRAPLAYLRYMLIDLLSAKGLFPQIQREEVKRPADQRRYVRLSVEQYHALGVAIRSAEQSGETLARNCSD